MHRQHSCGADLLFDMKSARREMKRYRKKGPSRSAKKILKKLAENELTNNSLHDIGGGIGAIQWFFLRQGARKTLDVDASGTYLQLAEILHRR
ncbi:MAG: hypothetical protein KFF73_19220 [Cyclobacteriaceae bacterium]|nr:hypothetical protein [Cyclobacteriaceae bacterium]